MIVEDKINEVFEALQHLDIKPTPHNVSIMCGVYDFLKIIYKELEGLENVGTESGNYNGKHGAGTEAEPESRDSGIAENGATVDLS